MRQRQSCSVVPIKDMLLPWNRRLPALPEKPWSYTIIKLVLRMNHASRCRTRNKHIEIWFPRFKTLEPGKVKMYVCQWLSRSQAVSEKAISCHKVSSGFRKQVALRIAVCYIDYIVRVSWCIKPFKNRCWNMCSEQTDRGGVTVYDLCHIGVWAANWALQGCRVYCFGRFGPR